MAEQLTSDELLIFEALKAARTIQNYLWQDSSFIKDDFFDMENWVVVFQKRVDKIAQLNMDNPSFIIELRKRVLQQAALSIQALELIDTL